MLLYRFLADLVVVIHFTYVLFVVLGMAVILLGIILKWRWVRNFWFRIIHFLLIALVIAESLLGIVCPLTAWEDILREKAGQTVAEGTFLVRWIHKLLFWDISPGIMTLIYCLFGLAVLLVLFLAPPRWPGKESSRK
jgi:hypothetical protein